jgi:hypothetical protein
MGSEGEQKGTSTIEELLPTAANVYIDYVDGGQLLGQGGWLELNGEGMSALGELVQRFGQQGTDAFNKVFITPDFEQGMENRIKRLTRNIVDTDSEDDAPDISWTRGQWDAERGGLGNLLRNIRKGEEVSIRLGGKDGKYLQRGYQFVRFPAEDAILVKLKKPNSTVAQPNS